MNSWTPATVVEYLVKLHFISGHRRVVGAICTLLGVILLGAAHPSVGAADPRLAQIASYLTGGGIFCLTIGILFRNDPAKLGPAPKATP